MNGNRAEKFFHHRGGVKPKMKISITFLLPLHLIFSTSTQVPSMTLFDKKMVRRCGVWQIKRMNSQDKDQVLMKSNMLGFGGYSQMKF